MVNLTQFSAKICLTASGCLIHHQRVLLVKHRKLGVWLCPGGHIEPGELPHQAAEREFWEETGIKVQAKLAEFTGDPRATDSQELPCPFSCNLHWISQQNYERRVNKVTTPLKHNVWSQGCEQHYNQLYLVKAIGSLDFKESQEEVDGIGWFSVNELHSLETYQQIKNELQYAFQLTSGQ